jgi:hypothetical protein
MSARSVAVTFFNLTSHDLILDTSSVQLQHGEWKRYPPSIIPSLQYGEWESDSDGIYTGTQGSLQYQFQYNGIQNIPISWDDPYYGGNSYGISCSSSDFKTRYAGGDGDNAVVQFFIDQKGSG